MNIIYISISQYPIKWSRDKESNEFRKHFILYRPRLHPCPHVSLHIKYSSKQEKKKKKDGSKSYSKEGFILIRPQNVNQSSLVFSLKGGKLAARADVFGSANGKKCFVS